MAIPTHCVPAGAPWATNQMSVITPSSTTTTFFEAAGGAGNRRGRVIYFPSTAANSQQINISTGGNNGLLPFATTMAQDGWQVLAVDELGSNGSELINDVLNDSAHGTRVVQTTLHYFDHVMQYAAQNHGGAMPTIVCGYSRGAWNSLEIGLNRQSQIIGLISRSSPTQWNASPTDTIFGEPAFAGQNTSGINITTNSTVPVTSTPTISGGILTLTTTGSYSSNGVVTGAIVSVSEVTSGGSGGTFSKLIGSYTVQSGATSTTITVPYSGTTPTGTYNSSGLVVSINSGLNSVTVPAMIAFGEINELVAWNELKTMGNTAIANGNTNIAVSDMSTEGHQWALADSALYTALTYSGSVTYPANTIVTDGTNAYVSIASTVGHTPPNATYWTLIGTQSSQGWVQANFNHTAYPEIY